MIHGDMPVDPVDASRLRVAMLAPISWRVPPKHYGPWERFVSLLTEGLIERGVSVTLFATANSITKAHLVGTAPRGYSEDPSIDAKVWECLHISAVFERAAEFDLIHNSFDFLPLTYGALVDTPVLTTIHGFSSERIVPVFEKYNRQAYYVAISDADRHEKLDYVATIHHGIDIDAFRFCPKASDYLLFFGRIHADKGTREAIEIAKRSGRRLVIAGIVQDERYFKTFVEPALDGKNVEFVGSVGPERRAGLLGGALALLHPIQFEEPFGLSVVESMACGTPVIAFRRGSMPEVVKHGETGFLLNNVDEAVDAVERLHEIGRAHCRKWVEERFTVERMVDGYLSAYEKVLERWPPVLAARMAARRPPASW